MIGHGYAFKHPHPTFMKQTIQQPFASDCRGEQFRRLNCLHKRHKLASGIIVRLLVQPIDFIIAARQVDLAYAFA